MILRVRKVRKILDDFEVFPWFLQKDQRRTREFLEILNVAAPAEPRGEFFSFHCAHFGWRSIFRTVPVRIF